jgi:hypothetical protein
VPDLAEVEADAMLTGLPCFEGQETQRELAFLLVFASICTSLLTQMDAASLQEIAASACTRGP